MYLFIIILCVYLLQQQDVSLANLTQDVMAISQDVSTIEEGSTCITYYKHLVTHISVMIYLSNMVFRILKRVGQPSIVL